VTGRFHALVATVALLAPAIARAQTAPRPDAEALFDAGRTLLERGEVKEACEKFEASEALDPAVGTMLYLGDCYEKTGRTASAWSMFREAESVARETNQDQRRQIAHTRATALEARLVRIQVEVPPESRVPGLSVTVGAFDVPGASWGAPFPVDPGDVLVAAKASAHAPWAEVITVAAEDRVRVIRIPPLAVLPTMVATPSPGSASEAVLPVTHARPESALDDADRGEAQRVAGILLGGTGLAGIVVASVLGAQALQRNDDSLSMCRPEDPTKCTEAGVAQRRSARDFALGSTVGFAIGGTLALGGVILFFTAPRGDTASKTRAASPRPSLSASFSDRGAAVEFGGAW